MCSHTYAHSRLPRGKQAGSAALPRCTGQRGLGERPPRNRPPGYLGRRCLPFYLLAPPPGSQLLGSR